MRSRGSDCTRGGLPARSRLSPSAGGGPVCSARGWALSLGGLLLVCSLASSDAASPDRQFTWMYGLQGMAGLTAAQQLGLNTLYLPTTTAVDSVEESRRTAQAARQAGMQVIVGLPTLSAERAADPDDPQYVTEVGARIRTVVRQFLNEPAVTAWAMADYPERFLRYTPQGFQAFLQRRYASLEALNAAWGSSFPTWTAITLTSAREVDATQPYQVGRASVEVADYQADVLRRLLAFWAREVRNLDARPLVTGRLALYRSLVSVPEEYAYVVPEAAVDVLEADYLTQNVQAVDLARQGGAVEVIPSLRLPVPPEPHYASGVTVGRWLREAILHGARGVALDGAERIRQCNNPGDVLTKLAEQLKPLAGAFSARPQGSLAVLYEPYAEGLQASGVPAYGYLPGLATGQPSLLMQTWRLGSRYGVVDYLSAERLLQADLEHYSAILAPTALKLPVEVQAKLRAYVERGGRLICDLGAGMYETGSWQRLPEELGRLCGIADYGVLQTKHGDLTLSPPTALFPSLRPPLRSRGLPKQEPPPPEGATERRTYTGTPPEKRGYTIQGLVGYVSLAPGARPLALVDAQVPETKPPTGRGSAAAAEARSAAQAAAKFAGLVGQPYGLGWAAYCSAILWARWDPADPFFQGLHADLWAPRARYVLRSGGGLEMSAEEQALHLYNPTDQTVPAEVAVLTENNRLYAGAVGQVQPPPARETMPVTMVVRAEPAAGELITLRRVPVAVYPYGTAALAYLSRYGSQGIALEIAGPGALLTWTMEKQRTFTQGQEITARVVIEDGEYPVTPGSRHRVKMDGGFGRRTTETRQADEQGRLSFEVRGGRVLIEVRAEADVV